MNKKEVNRQVTDSIAQVGTEIIGTGASVSMGNLFQATSQSHAIAAYNATNAQQQNNINAFASVTVGLQKIYTGDGSGSDQEIKLKKNQKKSSRNKKKQYTPYPLMYKEYPR